MLLSIRTTGDVQGHCRRRRTFVLNGGVVLVLLSRPALDMAKVFFASNLKCKRPHLSIFIYAYIAG
jgi:hypothetical protein